MTIGVTTSDYGGTIGNINIIGGTGGGTKVYPALPPPQPTITAPPPSDPGIIAGINPLDVAAATYGKVIPIVVGGAPRIGGYIIYGPKFTTVAGLSYVSFGVSFGLQADPDGERELWEIRMDGVKVWTIEDGALIDGLTFRFTEGTEVQEPDAMLIADYGAAAPAFRSQCCLFFQSLAIARFDNHVPFVSAVLADVTDGADPSDGILLGDALERLASSAFIGLDSDRFETTGITTIIMGLIEAERGSFIDLLQRLARLFPLDIVQTDKLRVVERSSIAADIVLNTNRIVGGLGAVQIQRQSETDVAQELEFIYIDIDRDYEFTPQKARRPSDPVAITASRAKETINLPIVTTASNAISWVTLRKYWDEVARTSVSFTAMPYGMEIDPGTMVAVKLDLGTYVIRVAETSHEARGTVKCTGTPVLRCSVSAIDDGPEIGDEEDDDIVDVFVAAGYDPSLGEIGVIETSSDGGAWAEQTSVPTSDTQWQSLTDINRALFVIVGSDASTATIPLISTSPDGETWTARTVPLGAYDAGYIQGVYSGDGPLCVATGYVQNTGFIEAFPAIWTSPDGVTWTLQFTDSLTAPDGGQFTEASFANGVYVATAWDYDTGDCIVYTSTNGVSWAAGTTISDANILNVETNGSTFVICGRSGATLPLVYTSSDGVAWTPRTPPLFTGSIAQLNRVRWIENIGLFVAVGYSSDFSLFYGFMATSPDGITWTAQIVDAPLNQDFILGDVSWSGDTLVCVGHVISPEAPLIFTSPDAETWAPQTPDRATGSLFTVFGRS